MSEELWLYIGGLILAVILVAAFWKKIVRAILLLAVLGLGGMIAWAFAQQAAATRQVATAATVAARGSAAANIAVALLVGLCCVGAVVIAVYVLARRRMTQVERWTQMSTPQYPQMQAPQMMSDPGMVNALVQLEVLRALRALRAPEQTALVPVERDDEDGSDVYGAWWGNA